MVDNSPFQVSDLFHNFGNFISCSCCFHVFQLGIVLWIHVYMHIPPNNLTILISVFTAELISWYSRIYKVISKMHSSLLRSIELIVRWMRNYCKYCCRDDEMCCEKRGTRRPFKIVFWCVILVLPWPTFSYYHRLHSAVANNHECQVIERTPLHSDQRRLWMLGLLSGLCRILWQRWKCQKYLSIL